MTTTGVGGTAGSVGTGGTAGGGGGQGGAGGTTMPPPDPCSIKCAWCSPRGALLRTVVTTSLDEPITAIAVKDQTLFFATNPVTTPGEIRSMPIAGGDSTVLVPSVSVREMVVVGAWLYYTWSIGGNQSLLSRIPVSGGLRVDITRGEISYLTFADSWVYYGWSGGASDSIERTHIDTLESSKVVDVKGRLSGLTVNLQAVLKQVYWTANDNGGGFFAHDLVNDNETTLHTSVEPISSPVVNGGLGLFVEGIATPDTCRSAIRMAWISSPRPAMNYSPGTTGINATRLAMGQPYLYWLSVGIHGAVLRGIPVPVTEADKKPEIVASEQRSASGLVVTGTDVFWIVRSDATSEVRTTPTMP